MAEEGRGVPLPTALWGEGKQNPHVSHGMCLVGAWGECSWLSCAPAPPSIPSQARDAPRPRLQQHWGCILLQTGLGRRMLVCRSLVGTPHKPGWAQGSLQAPLGAVPRLGARLSPQGQRGQGQHRAAPGSRDGSRWGARPGMVLICSFTCECWS